MLSGRRPTGIQDGLLHSRVYSAWLWKEELGFLGERKNPQDLEKHQIAVGEEGRHIEGAGGLKTPAV